MSDRSESVSAACVTRRGLRPGTWLAVALVATSSGWQFLGKLDEEPFFPDEQSLVAQAYYWNLYLGRATAVPIDAWNDTDWLRYAAYDHPPLIKYLIGIGLQVGGVPIDEDLGPWERWRMGLHERPEGLYWARVPVALCGVGACLALLGLGTLMWGRLAGIAAAVLVMANPLFLTHSRRAMRDVMSEFFVLAAVLLVCWAWPRLLRARGAPPAGRGVLRWLRWPAFALGAGALCAMATLSRLTGAVALLLTCAILVLGLLLGLGQWLGARRRGEHARLSTASLLAVVPALAIAAAAGAGVVGLLNPFLHARPGLERIEQAVREERLAPEEAEAVQSLSRLSFWERLRFLAEFRRLWRKEALEDPRFDPFDPWRLHHWNERVRAVFWQGFGRYSLLGRRRHGWHHELKKEGSDAKPELFLPCLWSHAHGDPAMPGEQTKLTWPCLWPAVVFFPLTVWGLLCMVRGGWKTMRAGRPPVVWGVALYVFFVIGTVPAYIPWAWDRYFLPLVAAGTLAQVYGIAAVLGWFGNRLVLRPPGQRSSAA